MHLFIQPIKTISIFTCVRSTVRVNKNIMEGAQEDDLHVILGPESDIPLLQGTVGRYLYERLMNASPNSVAMIDSATQETLFCSQLLRRSIHLAQGLRARGYHGQQTMVAVFAENNLEYFTVVLACLFNGSPLAPLNPSYTAHELNLIMPITKPMVIFTSEVCVNKLLEMNFEHVQKIIVLGENASLSAGDKVESVKEFIQDNIEMKQFQPMDGETENLLAFIMCSSGTTGLPKGVALSHQSVMVRFTQAKDPQYFLQSTECKVLGMLPFFHGYGLTFVLNCIASLQTVICLAKFQEDTFLKTIRDYQINILPLVPPLAIFMAKSPKVLDYDLSSVQDVMCGAAPLDYFTEELVKKRLNHALFRQGLGMTESTATVTLISLKDRPRPGSCGKVMTFTSGKVRDPNSGRSLGPGEVGELCWKGPLIMLGYYNNPSATEESFTKDGWFKSGDLGYYDEEGYFYVVDRLKEIIKYKGYQIAPAELEALLIKHPLVEDVGVIGTPDDVAGELPTAFVVRKHGRQVSEDDIKRYIAELVSPQKRLRGGVVFVASIPRNPSGKILRRRLKEYIVDHNVLPSKL